MILKNSLLGFIACLGFFSYGQVTPYKYQRPLTGIIDEWHTIDLPDAIYEKINTDFNDLRIYGITETKDTVEAPYFISIQKEEIFNENVVFEVVNKVKNESGYFYTLKMLKEETINEINLNFDLLNYDWRIRVEGSHDNKNWFVVTDNYRILSIHTEFTNYTYNHISFPNATFTYFRVFVASSVDPQFSNPDITLTKTVIGKTKGYEIQSQKVIEDKKNKITVISVKLKNAVPISQVEIRSSDQFDYYRPLKIERLVDSTKTKNGYQYHYETLARGTMSSFEKNNFGLYNTVSKDFRITIENNDNRPLSISNIHARGNIHQLHARFLDKADYILAYGNPNARTPVYDIDNFRSSVPGNLKSLTVGKEVKLFDEFAEKNAEEGTAPLLESKLWIWLVMGIAIVILGWFSFKMLRSEGSGSDKE